MADAYIIDAARTPRGIGKAGRGALSHFHSGRLLAKVFEAIGGRNQPVSYTHLTLPTIAIV